MRAIHLYLLRTTASAGLLCTLSACQPVASPNITVIINGDVHTMDARQPHAEAVVIENDKLVYVGSNSGAHAWQTRAAQIIDAHGHTVLPGLIDTHIHTVVGAIQSDDCSLDDEKLLITQMREKIIACLSQSSDDKTIFPVINLNPANFVATKHDLDAISTRAFALFGSDGHTAWANTAALNMAALSRTSADPKNGRITRDHNGDPTGHLIDDAVTALTPFLPQDDFATQVKMTEKTLHDLHAVGITSMMEAAASENELKVYHALAQRQKLTVHTSVALQSEANDSATHIKRLNDWRRRFSLPPQLQVDTVKIFADGVLEYPTQSAALLTPYLDENGNPTQTAGKLYVEPDVLNRFVAALDRERFNVHFHAIGDRAVRVGLDAFEYARTHNDGSNSRFSISHLQLIDDADLARFADLNVIASFQLFWAKPENYSVEAVQPYIGPQRSERLYAAGAVARAGGTIAGGSDWNVSTFNPFEAMAAGMCRCNENEPQRPLLAPAQAVDLATLLRAYTLNAATLLGREHETGSLTVGKFADVVILDRRLHNDAVDAIRSTKVVATFAQGQMVYRDM